MPLALLLQNLTGTLGAASKALTAWNEIVTLEATIVERARSAFLVHWFGRRLPFEGLSLRAHVVNVVELDRQFLAAQRSVPASQGAPNLTEPLLGFAGMVGGVLLSPIGAIAGSSALLRFAGLSLTVLLGALLWVAAPALLAFGLVTAPAGTAILVGAGLAAAGVGFALAAVLGDRREIRGVYDLFGSLARLMNATVVVLGQFMVPNDQVRNPLLRRLLGLTAPLAALFAQLLGVVAVVVTRVAPVLEPVARTLVGIGGLARASVAALDTVVSGLMERVGELSGRLSIAAVIGRVVAVARQQLTTARDAVPDALGALAGALGGIGSALATAFAAFGARLVDVFGRLLLGHPAVRVLDALATEVTAIKAIFAAAPTPPAPGTPPSEPGLLDPLLAALPTLPPLPAFPSLPPLPDSTRLRRDLGAGAVADLDAAAIGRAAEALRAGASLAPVGLSPSATTAVERVGRRPGMVAAQRRALDAERALALNRTQLEQFRSAFAVVVGRVLPPEVRATAAPRLAGVFAQLDHHLYGDPARAADPDRLPVLDLPTSDELRPVVRTLRLRMPGATVGEVRRFEQLVTERLRAQSYRATEPARAGGGLPVGGGR